VRDLLLTLAVALVIGLVVFGAVAFTLGRATGLEPVSPDAAPHDLPTGATVKPADVDAVRFDVVLRGYRMDQVDSVLERLSYDLGVRDDEIRALREELRAGRAGEVGTTTEVIPIPDGLLDGAARPGSAPPDTPSEWPIPGFGPEQEDSESPADLVLGPLADPGTESGGMPARSRPHSRSRDDAEPSG
jgi:DivIVA domain-containing protein